MLLIDVGSTFTKLVVLNPDTEMLLGSVHAPTTIYSDVSIGFRQALDQLQSKFHIDPGVLKERYACSSAAGGLRMIAIGLIFRVCYLYRKLRLWVLSGFSLLES